MQGSLSYSPPPPDLGITWELLPDLRDPDWHSTCFRVQARSRARGADGNRRAFPRKRCPKPPGPPLSRTFTVGSVPKRPSCFVNKVGVSPPPTLLCAEKRTQPLFKTCAQCVTDRGGLPAAAHPANPVAWSFFSLSLRDVNMKLLGKGSLCFVLFCSM